MSTNPYEPPLLPGGLKPRRRRLRPKGPGGYVLALLVGILLGGTAADSVGLWNHTGFGMVFGGALAMAIYHFLPHYEQRDE